MNSSFLRGLRAQAYQKNNLILNQPNLKMTLISFIGTMANPTSPSLWIYSIHTSYAECYWLD